MIELSFTTISIIAWSKILLLGTVLIAAFLIWKKPKAWLFALLASVSVTTFYLIISAPLKTMWWGTNGDEIFIVSSLTQVMHDSAWQDFYYHNLPPFYPPLYFWITGLIGKLFVNTAIGAMKIGVAATLSAWFIGTYAWLQLFRTKIHDIKNTVVRNPWFWMLSPLLFFFLLDFNDIILKPYETLPALILVFWLGLLSISLQERIWNKKHYAFFGLTGALLFLSYYFWWFIILPALFVIWVMTKNRKITSLRIIGTGSIIATLASVYLLPLAYSYRNGIENWQALFFVPHDFTTFLPFETISWRLPIIILGIAGLIFFYKKTFIKSLVLIVGSSFLYYYLSVFFFIIGKHPIQAAKPFLFLVSAVLAISAAYTCVWAWNKYADRIDNTKPLVLFILILSLVFWPMASWIDDPIVINQIEQDQKADAEVIDVQYAITKNVPDYKNRTWLSTGIPKINAYIPLHYYVAYNPHFSHHAAKYSERLTTIERLTTVPAEGFKSAIESLPIDALLLKHNVQTDTYPLYFWQDNYPNGGKEKILTIPTASIDTLTWKKHLLPHDWILWIR